MNLEFEPFREVQGNFITRFLSDKAVNLASFLLKHASARSLMYTANWDDEEEEEENEK